MKPSEIEVGKTYRNKGAGRTRRRVLAIHPVDSREYVEMRWSGSPETRPVAPVVEFYQAPGGRVDFLFIASFAAWAGSVVDGDDSQKARKET